MLLAQDSLIALQHREGKGRRSQVGYDGEKAVHLPRGKMQRLLVDLRDLPFWINHSYTKLIFCRIDKQALILRKDWNLKKTKNKKTLEYKDNYGNI